MEGPKSGQETEKVEKYELLSERDENLRWAQEAVALLFENRFRIEDVLMQMKAAGYTFSGTDSRRGIIN